MGSCCAGFVFYFPLFVKSKSPTTHNSKNVNLGLLVGNSIGRTATSGWFRKPYGPPHSRSLLIKK